MLQTMLHHFGARSLNQKKGHLACLKPKIGRQQWNPIITFSSSFIEFFLLLQSFIDFNLYLSLFYTLNEKDYETW
jgi:hypothetical protein